MWDLIKLEYRKYKIKKELWGFLIGNIILYSIFLFVNCVGFSFEKGIVMKPTSPFGVYNTIMMISVGVIIYGGFLFIELFNEEIEGNTIKITYLFPQGRNNIVTAKALATLLFTAVISIATYIIQMVLVLATKNILGIDDEAFKLAKVIENFPNFILSFMVSILVVSFIIVIATAIKSATFHVLSVIALGISASFINFCVIHALENYTLISRIALLLVLGFILSLSFIKILKLEIRRDV